MSDNLLPICYNRPQFATIGSTKMSTSHYENLTIFTDDLSSVTQHAFDFQFPGRLIFGEDTVNQLGGLMVERPQPAPMGGAESTIAPQPDTLVA